jgi:uncharacterized protein (TIGR02285 family)
MAALILLLLALLWPPPAAAAETIEWMVQDLPPVYIRSGPDKGTGIGERQLAALMQRLPDFQHKIVDTTFARAWHDIADHDNVCISGVQKTAERASVALFSKPIATAFGTRLVMRADQAERFKDLLAADGKVRLDALAQRGDLKGGYAAKRSFNNRLDAFLHKDTQLVKMEALPNEYQLFNLLKNSRIDFMFASWRELEHYEKQEEGPHQFKALLIEGEAERVDVYVACSDKPVGQKLVRRVDWLLENTDLPSVIRDLTPR